MPTNLEIKASYGSVAAARAHASRIGARYAGQLDQVDTYFKVKSGRLKIREINGKRSELIYYHRGNEKRSRYSDYSVIEISDPAQVKSILRNILGIRGIVRKRRLLYLYQNGRIHIDSVQKLGTFIEFEIIVRKGKKQARSLMKFLCREFDIDAKKVIGHSYSEMISSN